MDSLIDNLVKMRDEYFRKHKKFDASIPVSLYVGMGINGLIASYLFANGLFQSKPEEYEYYDESGNPISPSNIDIKSKNVTILDVE
jgi:hypothetical protein